MTEHFDMTFSEKIQLIVEVFAKIAHNFWPVIVLAIVAMVIVHKQESSCRGYGFKTHHRR